MRLLAGILVCALAAPGISADPATRQRLIRYFGGWYPFFPGSRVSVAESGEIVLPGLEAYRVRRHSESKFHGEANVALVDRVRDEVFVGDVFHDDARKAAGRPFDAAADLPLIQGSLREAFGLIVTEYLDFQCERCRRRSPAVHRFVAGRGGSVETRFLPVVKPHDWAFEAAEAGAALALVSDQLYARYAEAVFAPDGMDGAAARQLASDIAEGAGKGEEYAGSLANGRARRRVLADIELAMRLGIYATPCILHRGTLVSGEEDLLEALLADRTGGGEKPAEGPGKP